MPAIWTGSAFSEEPRRGAHNVMFNPLVRANIREKNAV